jgi:hypothetical protein
MPPRLIPTGFRDALQSTGIGLYFFSETEEWPFVTAVEARLSESVWDAARDTILTQFTALVTPS